MICIYIASDVTYIDMLHPLEIRETEGGATGQMGEFVEAASRISSTM